MRRPDRSFSPDNNSNSSTSDPILKSALPACDDAEGERLPSPFSNVIDAHVHLFPDELFTAIWGWFDHHAWPVRYQMKASALVRFLLQRGISHIIALHYAHKPGIARTLNAFMARFAASVPQVTGMATIYPGETDATAILKEAFDNGLRGVKLHSHVQCFDMESAGMQEVYDACVKYHKPLVMHVGREPKSPAYPCDPYRYCKASILEEVIKAHPDLKVCVPHLGADEFASYRRLLEMYDNLWLDTAMMTADYFPGVSVPPLRSFRGERIMYGTDFPNIPYAWDRELKQIAAMGLRENELAPLMAGNAIRFFDLSPDILPGKAVSG